MRHPRRILFATDFSPASRAAWKEALQMAGSRGRLLIAHVLRLPLPLPGEMFLPRTADELTAVIRRDAGEAIRSLVKKAREAGVRAEGLLLTGKPEESIGRTARKHGVDLLVVGTHGRTGLPRLILGSVASRIIAAAPCPVLAVPRRTGSRRTVRKPREKRAFSPARRDSAG